MAGYEKSDTNVKMIAIVAVGSILFVVIAVIFLNELFLAEKEQLIYDTYLTPESEELIKLRKHEASESTTYRLNDSTGHYQIPIDRAMELIAAEADTKR